MSDVPPAVVVLPMIRKGEYDLANISLLGSCPVTGRTYEECRAEWSAAHDYLVWRIQQTRWWQVWRIWDNRKQTLNLYLRLGLP